MGTLEIEQNLDGQATLWILQRCARAAIGLFLAAGAFGVFGGGWFGHERTADQSGTLVVTHARFARTPAPGEMKVEIGSALIRDGEVALWIDRVWLDGLEVQSIQPEPFHQTVEHGRISYRFHVNDTSEPVAITLQVTTRRGGFCRGRVGVADGPAVTLTRLVYP